MDSPQIGQTFSAASAPKKMVHQHWQGRANTLLHQAIGMVKHGTLGVSITMGINGPRENQDFDKKRPQLLWIRTIQVPRLTDGYSNTEHAARLHLASLHFDLWYGNGLPNDFTGCGNGLPNV